MDRARGAAIRARRTSADRDRKDCRGYGREPPRRQSDTLLGLDARTTKTRRRTTGRLAAVQAGCGQNASSQQESRESGYYNASVRISPTARNFAAAAAIGATTGLVCWVFLHHFHLGGGDFNWAYTAARDLLSRVDPYSHTPPGTIPYPLPAVLPAFPLAFLSPEAAVATFFCISSGLLALGLILQDPTRLLIFFA